MKVTFYTLGCKLNQSESISMANELNSSGYEIISESEKPEICIINTCTVTSHSDQRCRQMIRKYIKENPNAIIIVTGCYAERNKNEILQISGVNLVIGNLEKANIVEHIEKIRNTDCEIKEKNEIYASVCGDIGKTRAFIKIQDGCNFGCSYCIVPKVRGKSRSVPIDLILKEIEKVVNFGYPEIVLTGINIGAYGKDIPDYPNLYELLKEILRISSHSRIRLSSIEPDEVTDEIINLIVENQNICRHLHIPLQSGTDEILKLMNRRYSIKNYINVLDRVIKNCSNIALGTDLIVGFPGETDALFQKTKELVESLALNYIHVFPYSRREGTASYLINETVTEKEKKERVKIVRDIFNKKMLNYKKQFINKTLKAVIETTRHHGTGKLVCLTDNYLRVLIDGNDSLMKKSISIRIKECSDDILYWEII
ncbi:tRNA (N(6)-L-threonylcarbamoyladenosine(37)-C(2))-methylthiotransferase MtaB, partial [Candidatus Poribacteria bacterium]|nr:tRNA (N(6)-L-threonylcarbamoyladenosine(37)-C(2))-methylthiotransferase MtaB [Candidatus Poribacteria bacterium]